MEGIENKGETEAIEMDAALDFRELLHLHPPHTYTDYNRFEAIMFRFFAHQREHPDATVEESWRVTMEDMLKRDEILKKFLTHCSLYARNGSKD